MKIRNHENQTLEFIQVDYVQNGLYMNINENSKRFVNNEYLHYSELKI